MMFVDIIFRDVLFSCYGWGLFGGRCYLMNIDNIVVEIIRIWNMWNGWCKYFLEKVI